MEVVKADILGYCFGVRRAVEKAEKALAESAGGDVYSLGPLIHNKSTLNRLQNAGLKIAEKISDIPNGSTVIIRAHGVPPSVISELENKSCVIVDATCPRVKKSQKIAAENSSDDIEIIFTGDAEHGEVKGIAGYAGNNFHLIQNVEDAISYPNKGGGGVSNPNGQTGAVVETSSLDKWADGTKKIILFSQTTFSETEFEKIKNILSEKFNNIEVINTICPATKERQDALLDLCGKVDGVLVVGGKQSANTVRLYQTAAANCEKAVHIETADEIPQEFFLLQKVGITAGASTPDEVIDEIYLKLCYNK